ncbi:uroporphyrinogen-III C-methyltransferase [Fulvimarina endophytica]|uniref:Uroporphyrinogen-III C-methyltransferase n=1 Tax=Fulvimarina endophytica TaxID=2293836 RepID=A0A371WYX1_9HYPH|nr:siroheme synthase CysG [Fulvimarina endophytica]RFC62149.1 uroporphyrinogen-III C-methyltransferase [Fulvimarina endophytica]
MGPLAVLPVFYDLKDRRVVMTGGGDGAAWKAELLASCGARVDLYVPAGELGEEMTALLGSDIVRGAIRHFDRPWALDVFAGAGMAVGDVESEAEAQAFRCAAKAAGVPVNVVDKPAYCDFTLGSIVNRSPLVVGISTAGAAPILGQAARRRIETLLPPGLKGWAEAAADIRASVVSRLKPGPERRSFWERFSDLAFKAKAPESRETLDASVHAIAASGAQAGRVTLVGAGPGEAELLTLKAVRALQAADVILFDDLVSSDILELARREAKRMLVGKRAARESCKQEDINRMMVEFAEAGKSVVRLKSGDVSIFGRAGEEIAELRQRGIPVEIVPGITAASALAASFGISLTHRDHAQQLRFITGHSKRGDLPDDVNWAELAGPRATTIFYMGGRMAHRITDRLVGEGMDGATPVAVAANISRADETRLHGRLDQLGAIVDRIGVDRPILIGVGDVFGEIASHVAAFGEEGAEPDGDRIRRITASA